MSSLPLFIGSYSIPSPWTGTPNAHGDGIVCAEFDSETGEIRIAHRLGETNPSFLIRDAVSGRLWAITEPETGGEFIAFAAAPDGVLKPSGRLVTGFDAPCHLTIDTANELAFASHYHGGGLSVARLAGDGFAPPPTLVTPPGQARQVDRAGQPALIHASVRIGVDLLLVADTGRDFVLLYRVGEAIPTLVDALPLPERTGPRHMAVHQPSSTIYLSNQGSGGVSVVRLRDERLEYAGRVAAPLVAAGRTAPSEVAVHPSGKALYLANRIDNSISAFEISPEGVIGPVGVNDVRGENPRHFAVTPDGSWLLVANQDSDNITAFRLVEGGRQLEFVTSAAVRTPTAVCF